MGVSLARRAVLSCLAILLASLTLVSQNASFAVNTKPVMLLEGSLRRPSPLRSSRSTVRGQSEDRFKREVREQKMEQYKEERNLQCDERGGWKTIGLRRRGSERIYAKYEYADSMFAPEKVEGRELIIEVCDVEGDGQSGWKIYRMGPMVGIGGYDRHEITVLNLPHPSKAKFLTGKMMAPVYKNGEIAGFPPLHSHHNMVGVSGVKHAFESHGDAICDANLGGEGCYLISYPDGYGVPFKNETVPNKDFMTLTLIFNDVRKNDDLVTPNKMLFYGEIALKWSANTDDVKSVSAAALHMIGKSHPYMANIVTKRPSLRWSTGTWPVDGKIIISPEDQLPWFHAHRSYFTAFWAFAASPEELGLTTKLLRKVDDNNQTRNGKLDKFDLVWTPDDPIRALEEKVAQSKKGLKSLRCWLVASDEEKVLVYVNETAGFSPELSEPWQQNWKGSWYDRAGEVHCNPWSFEKGDRYTVVGMNGIDDRYNWTHDQSDFFTMMQHNILFLLYETIGPELGPTMEMFGGFNTQGNMLMLKWSYVPSVFKNRTDYFFKSKKGLRKFEYELTQHMRKVLQSDISLMHDPFWQFQQRFQK